jgi:hypothetical protein
MTIDLTIEANSGTVTLHPINQANDTARPQFTALLSVGDKTAVDQTCSPLATSGVPPCTAPSSVSQVATSDATITVIPINNCVVPCIGDQTGDSSIDASEVVNTINAFAQDDVSLNPKADGNCSGSVEAPEVVQVINNFAQDSCNPPS